MPFFRADCVRKWGIKAARGNKEKSTYLHVSCAINTQLIVALRFVNIFFPGELYDFSATNVKMAGLLLVDVGSRIKEQIKHTW
jgi:hypothetical protein